jgi:hypothetical protein
MNVLSTNFKDMNKRQAEFEEFTDFADITITEYNWNSNISTGSIELRLHFTPGDLLFLDALREAVDKAIKWARAN